MRAAVHKLGGSIMGNGRLLKNVLNAVDLSEPEVTNVFVVSALNSSQDKSDGTTTLLSKVRRTGSIQEKIEAVKTLTSNYNSVYEHFGMTLSSRCQSILEEAFFKPTRDETVEAGELASSQMLVDIISGRGSVAAEARLPRTFKGKDVLFANPISRRGAVETFRSEFRPPDGTTVMPGFFHVGTRGTINAIGRGYSDVTGAIAASIYPAISYSVWKESGGVFSTHPSYYPKAKPVPLLTLAEARELTAFGNQVLHPLTAEFLSERPMKVLVRDAETDRGCDTVVETDPISYTTADAPRITAIASKSRLCIIDYKLAFPGSDLRFPFHPILLNVNRASVSALLSEDDYTFVPAKAPSSFSVRENRSVVACVGKGLRGSVGIASEIMGVLAKAGINVEMISQGSDEVCVAVAVRTDQERAAVGSLEDHFLA